MIPGLTIEKQPAGANPGQVILFIDLSCLPNAESAVLELADLGYFLSYRYASFKDGLHLLGILKDVQLDSFSSTFEDDYNCILNEWESLFNHFKSDSVRLWRGRIVSLAA